MARTTFEDHLQQELVKKAQDSFGSAWLLMTIFPPLPLLFMLFGYILFQALFPQFIVDWVSNGFVMIFSFIDSLIQGIDFGDGSFLSLGTLKHIGLMTVGVILWGGFMFCLLFFKLFLFESVGENPLEQTSVEKFLDAAADSYQGLVLRGKIQDSAYWKDLTEKYEQLLVQEKRLLESFMSNITNSALDVGDYAIVAKKDIPQKSKAKYDGEEAGEQLRLVNEVLDLM